MTSAYPSFLAPTRCPFVKFPTMNRLVTALLALLVASQLTIGTASAQRASRALDELPVPNGRYYTQASGQGTEAGYSITDDAGASFWKEFQRLGGVEELGFPASRRFQQGGFTHQATQKYLLQWRPESGRVVYANAFDVLSAAGRDEWLRTERMIPPPADFSGDRGLPWDQVVARHLSLLDANPQLRRAYFADATPVETFGLPQAIADMGPAVVLRSQRAAFQLWKVRTAFAQPGQITVVNGGDLVKESGLLPPDATAPEPAASVLVGPPNRTIQINGDTAATARRAAEVGGASLVRIEARTAEGESSGSGFLLSKQGHILTNAHVVEGARSVSVRLKDGREIRATNVAADRLTDLAIVTAQLPEGAVQPIALGDPGSLREGELVVAVGYSPTFPAPPTTRVGVYGGREQAATDILRTDVFLGPGDSGGPLLDMRGRVIGVNQAVGFQGRRGDRNFVTSLSIDVVSAAPVVAELIANGRVSRPFLGVQTASLTPALAAEAGLPRGGGALVREVVPGSPAAAAGVRAGEAIVAIGEQPIRSSNELAAVLGRHRVGDEVTVTLVSPDSRRTLRARLGIPPT